MSYIVAKHLHITCVALSIALFVLRGTLQLTGRPWRGILPLRVAPHFVDTALLGAALWMVFSAGILPFAHAWLVAKFVALPAYIWLGRIALGEQTEARRRPLAFAAALGCVAYIVGVALTHSPALGLP